jgi:ribosomal protein S28E/S33
MTEQEKSKERTVGEQFEVAGAELLELVKRLIREGDVRRIIIRNDKGEVLLEIPLTAGVVVGGVLTLFAPVLVAVGAMAALLTSVKVEVIRNDDASR